MNDAILIIPARDPTPELPKLVRALAPEFAKTVVVDDGSRAGRENFDPLAEIPGTVLLTHPGNLGKGAALKTAFRYVLDSGARPAAVVTADADGQHRAEDVLAVAAAARAHPDALILGVRSFAGAVPFRSRLGNWWTIGEFALLTGRLVRDTQSGLRAIPAARLGELLTVPGERYEYEIGVLVRFARRSAVVEIPVATVYLDGNRASHFRPFADTVRTQLALFRAGLARF